MARTGRGSINCRQLKAGEALLSTIDIHAYHDLSHGEAHQAADELSRDLATKFDIEYRWEGDEIHFQRAGVHGRILVNQRELRIQAHLGFMLMMLKQPIEREVVRYLTEHFGCRFETE
jgi:putative polyhydroxyalkanoate system protein